MLLKNFKTFISRWRLQFIVFLSGGILMVYELVGTRVTAPMVGNSLYTWTAIIGTILGCLSIGNYLGGVWADRNPKIKILSFILLWASLFIGLTNWLADVLGLFFVDLNIATELKTTLFALILFGPAALFLGMVSPFALKLALTNLSTSGKKAGLIYMFSTMGSIVGTFLAGFVLIPFLGTEQLIISLSLSLILVSLFAHRYFSGSKMLMIVVILVILLVRFFEFKNRNIIDVDTAYQRVRIFQFFSPDLKEDVVVMTFDAKGVQSFKYADSYKLASEYNKLMQAYKSVTKPPETALFIGGAGYVMPSYLFHTNSQVEIDVVEIDPQITQLARDYFDLVDDPRLKPIHQDGRLYLQQTDKKYDLVMLDAFGGEGLVTPFHLITKESFELIAQATADDGVVVVNLISPLLGDNPLFGSVYKTIDSVFEDVLVFGIKPETPYENQNIILVAGKSSLEFDKAKTYEYSSLVNNGRWTQIPSSALVLTDNYAPIEHLERIGRK